MADIQSNIKVNIDTSNALEQIKLLQSQISAFHTQMGKSGAVAAAQAAQLRQSLVNGINATGKFSAQMTNVKTSTEYFTSALEKNKLTMGEYFRYAGGASKTFGKLFKSEFETITKVARERVKDLQTQYIKMGRDANGAMQAIKVRPLMLDMDNLATKQAISSQKQQLLNQLLKQGSTNMLNFGKNTQWAGRQLMVGFTVPLMMLGSVAIKSFKEMEEAVVKFKRVYGDLSTGSEETNKMASDLKRLAESFTQYGVAVKDTMDMAATAAATGKMGADLMAQVSSATKLAVLGGVDQQKALETTISLTNAFGLSAEDLAKKIDFLNAVENQTVLSIDDLTTAIPKAAPVVQQLGGSVEDLAFFLTAMKEGGINASEGANALKSGLASLINPTNTASKMLAGFGINIKGIVQADKGNLKKTVVDFASALDKLDPLNRARAIEQMFGKFQFARLSTLFKNVVDQGSQAGKTLELTKATNEELAILSERELKKVSDSPLYKFEKSMKDFQNAMVPIGEQFLKALTPILNFVNGILKQFDGLGEGTKNFIVGFTAILAGVGPIVLMVVGLIANGIANIIKLFANFKSMFNNMGKSSKDLGSSTKYMTSEQIEAAAVAASLDQVHGKLTQTFTSEAVAIQKLVAEYQKAITAQEIFAGTAIPRGPMPRKYATGGFISGPGTGTSDSILARVSNGEAIIPAASVSKHPQLVSQLVSGNIPGFESGAEKLNVAGNGYSVIRGHLTDDMKYGSTMHEETIAKTSFGKIYSGMGKYMTVVSNLVAEMPHKLNVLLQEKVGKDGVRKAIGATPQQFSEQWNKRDGKLLLSAGLGGFNASSPQAMKYSIQLEKAIHDRAIAMAMATERQKIDDPMLARATRQVIDETIRAGGEAKEFALSLDAASKQVGQVRMNLPASFLKEGLASGKFVANGKNILYEGQNVGRLRSTGGFRPANPFKPSGSYNVAALRSLATEDGVQDGKAYNAGKKSQTDRPENDPYVETRNRNSPHVLSGPDGEQDAVAYNTARRATNAEFDVTEAEAARARSMSMQAIAAESGQVEGTAHAEARVAAARTENAEVLAIRQEGAAAEIAIIEEVNAAEMAVVGGVVAGGAGIGRRATIKAERKLARKEARAGKGMGAMMALSMLPMMASAIPGDIGKAAQDNMMPLMALSMLPMLGAKLGGIAVIIGLLVASIMSFVNAVNTARDKALELAMATGTSAEAMSNLSKSAGKVTAGDVMDRRRLEQNGVLAIQPGQHTFGESFVQSETGKSLMTSIGQNTKENGAAFAAEQLTKQMESAVMSGAMSMAQARSSVAAIATAMGDRQLGISIIGKMTKLLGPNGENLTKNGLSLKVRLDMVKEDVSSRSGMQNVASKATEMRAQDFGNVLGYGAAGAGAGAVAGAIAGSAIGTVVPIIGNAVGAAIGAVVGTIAGGIAGVIHGMEDRAARISKAGGAFAGMDKNSLDQNKQILDSFELQYQKKHELLIEQGKINEAVALENKYYKARDKLLLATQGNKQNIIDNYLKNKTENSDLAGAYNTGVENQINKIYKNTNFSEMSQMAIDSINNSSLLDDSSKMSLKLSLEDKTLNPENIISLIDMFANKDQMDAFLNIDTKFGSTFSSQALQVMSGFVDSQGEVMPELQSKFMIDLSTKSSGDATKLLNTFTAITSFGNVIPTDISVKVFEDSPIKLANLQNVIDGISKEKGKIEYEAAVKILGGEKLSEFSKQAKIFNGLSEAGRRVFIAAYQTELSLKGDPKQMQAFELWQADHPGMGPADYSIFAGTQAEKIAKAGIDLTTSLDGGASTEATTPQASFLDQIVKGYRDAFSWQQKLTVGFSKSKAAIDGFVVKGFSGLAMQLAKAGVGSEAIQQILDAPQDEIDQIIDKTTGKIKTSFLKTLPKLAALNPFSLANITVKWLTMNKDQQDQERINMYQAGLDVIKGAEDKINKKYDERIKSLDSIKTLNDEINQSQQDEIDLADALTQGDMARAAKAMQQMQADKAKAAIEATRQSLQDARQSELDGTTTTLNGKVMSRAEIEAEIEKITIRVNIHKKIQLEKEIRIGDELDRQLKTAKDIAALGGGSGGLGNSDAGNGGNGGNNDVKKIIPKKDPNLLTQKQLDDMKANDPKSVIELKKSHSLQWGYIEQKITPLVEKIQGLGTQMAEIAKQYPFVTSVKASEKDLSNGRLNANEQRALYEYRQFGKAKSEWESDVTRLRRNQYSLGETGPGYYATGGHITGPGSGTSDDIPAMLSNGEYVVRAGAVKALGVSTLNKINQADRMKFANGGMAIPRFANGGYPKYADGGLVSGMMSKLEPIPTQLANGGMAGYEKGGKVGKAEDTAMSNRWMAMGKFFANNKLKSSKPKETRRRLVNNQMIYMAATDPKAPWNNGNWAQNGNDPELRKRYWQQYGWRPSWMKEGDPTSTEVMDVAKTGAYFIPGVGALTSFGDAGTSAEKKDYAGAAINTAFGASSLWMPGALKLIGEGLSKAGGMVRTGLGLRGGSNALKALASFVGTSVSKIGKLAPRLGFNISDEALQKMIKDNFYGNMRTGIRSSTSDSLMNRVAVEKNMMGIPANAPASKTPAYGFLTSKEDVPSYYNSIMGGMGPRSAEQASIDEFNQLINPMSRYLQNYGSNTIKLKPSTLGRATISMGDSLSIWDQAIRLGKKIPGVDKLSSIFSTFPSLSGVLKSTQNMMNKNIPGIKTPTSLPYIEAHLPGGFTLKDIESITLNPTTKFGPQAKEKIAADLAERKAALEALFESMGIKGIKITENNGIKIGSEALDGNYPLPTKGPSKYTFMDVIKGLMPAPKGTGVDKVTGSKPLMNPNISLFLKNFFGKNYHGGFNTAQNKNGLYKQAPFNIGKRPAKPEDVDPESWNTNWFRAEFFSTAAKKLASTYGQMFNVKMPLLSPLKMNMLDLYPGAKSVAEQYPELYAKHPELFGLEGDLLRPDRHLELAEMIGHNPDLINILKQFGIDAIRHQSAHGVQATLGGKGIFSEVFAYLNPATGMKAKPMPLANIIKSEKWLYEQLGKDTYMRRIKNMMLNPFKRIGYNVQNFFKDMFKDKSNIDVETLAEGGYVNGGMAIPRFKVGGYVGMMPKFGDGGLANLHQGEYVFQKSAVDRIGLNNLNAMNQGDTVSGDSVYNTYSVNVNVSSNSNPNDIANTVIREIRRIDNKKIRSNRI